LSKKDSVISTYDIALEKLRKYCAYQERCHQEVRTKLLNLKIYGDDLENIISDLIKENFLNEERFARAYARGKFRMKKWGRNKIKQELQKRRVSAYCIKKGMAEIDEQEYKSTLKEVLLKQMEKNSSMKRYLALDKSIKYAHSRGYEFEAIYKLVKELKLDQDRSNKL